MVSAREFVERFRDYTWDKAILDAAHDALPIYEYLHSRSIKPFIDLNLRTLYHTIMASPVVFWKYPTVLTNLAVQIDLTKAEHDDASCSVHYFDVHDVHQL
ncbi:hypothetical protein GCM10025859_04830 [Alicyclobacillus fastidiosus]|nr:hypothetical protein GCM10025859_04830 [Alicyclobacillus fastidiosus]